MGDSTLIQIQVGWMPTVSHFSTPATQGVNEWPIVKCAAHMCRVRHTHVYTQPCQCGQRSGNQIWSGCCREVDGFLLPNPVQDLGHTVL